MAVDNGGPVVAIESRFYDEHGDSLPGPEVRTRGGLSVRDWFAGQALAGWLARYDDGGEGLGSMDILRIAKVAYAIAEAMIYERRQLQPSEADSVTEE